MQRPEVLDQGALRAGFRRGISPWLAVGHPLARSPLCARVPPGVSASYWDIGHVGSGLHPNNLISTTSVTSRKTLSPNLVTFWGPVGWDSNTWILGEHNSARNRDGSRHDHLPCSQISHSNEGRVTEALATTVTSDPYSPGLCIARFRVTRAGLAGAHARASSWQFITHLRPCFHTSE